MAGAVIVFLFHSLGDLLFNQREVFWDFCLLCGAWMGALPEDSPRVSIDSTAQKHVVPSPAKLAWARRPVPLAGVFVLGAACWLLLAPDSMSSWYRQRVRDIWNLAPAEGLPMAKRMEALRLAGRATAWAPDNPWMLQLCAHAHGQVGRPDFMLHDLTEAARLHPLSAAIRADLADLEWRNRRVEEAFQWIDEAVSLHPLKSIWRERKAQYLLERGRGEEALREARQAAELAFTPMERDSVRRLLNQIEKSLSTERQP
jgi:tetratricopeptide (TPR) repeat protein